MCGARDQTDAALPLPPCRESLLLRTFVLPSRRRFAARVPQPRKGETCPRNRTSDRPPRLRGALEGGPRRRRRARGERLHRTRSGQSGAAPRPGRRQGVHLDLPRGVPRRADHGRAAACRGRPGCDPLERAEVAFTKGRTFGFCAEVAESTWARAFPCILCSKIGNSARSLRASTVGVTTTSVAACRSSAPEKSAGDRYALSRRSTLAAPERRSRAAARLTHRVWGIGLRTGLGHD